MLCDDDQDETADFICLDRKTKRLALVHAKCASEDKQSAVSVGAIQSVTRQATASLAFCSSVARQPKIKKGRWATQINANGKPLKLSRIFLNISNLKVSEIELEVSAAISDRSWNREIWMVLGRMMARSEIEKRIMEGSQNHYDNQTLQFLMHFESVATTCARAGPELKVYCHDKAHPVLTSSGTGAGKRKKTPSKSAKPK